MRLLLLTVFVSVTLVSARNNLRALTESMGQEVIEIETPIKGDLSLLKDMFGQDLPGDIEEEPSAEVDVDNEISTTTLQPATRKELKKTATVKVPNLRQKLKDIDVIDGEKMDDEKKIEKELAELYKDNADYKADSAERVTVSGDEKEVKPIERQNKEFRFQPNSNSAKDIERFRTSIDDISCDNRDKKKLHKDLYKSSASILGNTFLFSFIYSVTMLL